MSRTAEIHRRALVALFALALVALPLFGADDDDDRFELQFAKNLPYSGGRVTIDHGFGDLNIGTHDGSDVQVRATIRSSDANIGKQIRIVTSTDGGISVRTEFPTIRNFRGHLSYSVDMTVTLPASASLLAKNRFGNTEVRGLQAASVIDNKQGAVSFENGRGAHQISNAFGSVEVVDNRGDVTVSNSNGSVDVRKIDGRVSVTNRFGSIEVSDVQRDASLSGSNGAIEAMDIHGALKVTSSFGGVKASTIGGALTVDGNNARVEANGIGGNARIDTSFGGVTLESVRGAAEITNSNGNIKVSDVGNGLRADTRFGSVRAERIKGPTTVTNANGAVTLEDISGNISAKTSFGSVFIDGATGGVAVANANGAISVAGLRGGGCHPISLTTTFSAIKVSLPDEPSYVVNARTSFGKITSAFPVTATSFSSESLTGTIGKGGCQLELANSNGNITIDRE